MTEKFIHHETYSNPESGDAGGAGWFDVIEDEFGFYVFDQGAGMIAGRFETLDEAGAYAMGRAGL